MPLDVENLPAQSLDDRPCLDQVEKTSDSHQDSGVYRLLLARGDDLVWYANSVNGNRRKVLNYHPFS